EGVWSAHVERDHVRARQQFHTRKERLVGEDVLKGEVLAECSRIDANRHRGMLKQRLDLGSEEYRFTIPRVVERLYAEPVAREHNPTVALVVEREGEHPVELVQTAHSPCTPGLDQNLGVAVRAELRSTQLQLTP